MSHVHPEACTFSCPQLGVALSQCFSCFYYFSPSPAGISLSNEVCNLMAIRYGDPDLKISFESFMCFMLRVEIMGGEAHAMQLARESSVAQLSPGPSKTVPAGRT